MSFLACKSAATAATVAALLTSVATGALAQDTARTLANNEAILIDGKALTVTSGRAREDIAALIGNLSVRPLGPGAIVFRSGDRLYVVDGTPMGAAHAMYDSGIDRQRSYGGLYDPYPSGDRNDRQRSYGGLYDPYPSSDRNDRQRSYGGLYDPYPSSDRNDRQRSYGGLYDPYPSSDRNDRQRSYGGLNDPYPSSDYRNDRQRSYGGLNDPYPSSDYRNDRQRSYGGLNDPYPGSDRQRSYGGFYDSGAEWRRQQSYGVFHDPDYANYRLKKSFTTIWGSADKN